MFGSDDSRNACPERLHLINNRIKLPMSMRTTSTAGKAIQKIKRRRKPSKPKQLRQRDPNPMQSAMQTAP